MGEHGGTALAAWSLVNIAGIPINDFNHVLKMNVEFNKEEILKEVITIGYEIMLAKGFTNYGIAASVSRLVKAILLNELSILTVSTTLSGEYGIGGVALSVPCVITWEGIWKTLEVPLIQDEIKQLEKSAEHLKGILKNLP